jgi:hypothetical protein
MVDGPREAVLAHLNKAALPGPVGKGFTMQIGGAKS